MINNGWQVLVASYPSLEIETNRQHCTSWSDSMLQHSSDSVYVPMSLNLHHELRITEYKQYESK